jgi:uncharacterized LabA/DUF88 family protein
VNNLAFIDGQNLHLGSLENGWEVDYKRFRIYLKDKYKIKRAYYFIGYYKKSFKNLYLKLSKSGFILVFKKYSNFSLSIKKGNIDNDLIFEVMRILIEEKDVNKIFIISSDGDYKKLVNYLIYKKKFGKIIFPNKRFSSNLYNNLHSKYFDYLDNFKNSVEYK